MLLVNSGNHSAYESLIAIMAAVFLSWIVTLVRILPETVFTEAMICTCWLTQTSIATCLYSFAQPCIKT